LLHQRGEDFELLGRDALHQERDRVIDAGLGKAVSTWSGSSFVTLWAAKMSLASSRLSRVARLN
jgi:hypothetical protein